MATFQIEGGLSNQWPRLEDELDCDDYPTLPLNRQGDIVMIMAIFLSLIHDHALKLNYNNSVEATNRNVIIDGISTAVDQNNCLI